MADLLFQFGEDPLLPLRHPPRQLCNLGILLGTGHVLLLFTEENYRKLFITNHQ